MRFIALHWVGAPDLWNSQMNRESGEALTTRSWFDKLTMSGSLRRSS